MYERNVLVQPGPLTVPLANRSLDEPSYRIIDFGRGVTLGVNGFSLEALKREAESEKRYARRERLIPYSSSQSSASRKRSKPSENAALMSNLTGRFEGLTCVIKVPPSSSSGVKARATAKILQKHDELGDEWLPMDVVCDMVMLFDKIESEADFYLAIADRDAAFVGNWVQEKLESTRAGSGALR